MRLFFSAALASAALAACGSLGDASKREPLAVVQGRLVQQAAAPSSAAQVRVAVVWASITETRGYNVAQDVAATPVFPSSYRLELTDPPPASAMARRTSAPTPTPDTPAAPPQPAPGTGTRDMKRTDWPADFGVAVGSVVAYEDVNGNGKLDLVQEGAASYVDRILGANEGLILVYMEGTIPDDPSFADSSGHKPSRGYGLYRLPNCGRGESEPAAGASPPPCDDVSSGWRPISNAYDLPLTADPRFAKLMCAKGFRDSSSANAAPSPPPGMAVPPGPGPDGRYPAKNDPSLTCAEDGKWYAYTRCAQESQGLCKGEITTCSVTYWALPSATPPADWPCTVK